MKWFFNTKKVVYLTLFVISLLFILFVGRRFNPTTLQRDRILTTNGIHNFRKGLDIAGGTKLVYKIDFSKYEELYKSNETNANNEDFETIKKNIENIIIKNIDDRISALGVSDYRAYIQETNETQVVVEIGGVADLDQAKEIIGKTVELEFRLQNDKSATTESIAERKTLAQKLRNEAIAHPDTFLTNNSNKGADDIYANQYTEVKLEALPSIYQDHKNLLDSLALNEISPLLEGNYASYGLSGEENGLIKGFTFFRIVERNEENQTYSIEELFIHEHQNWVLAQGNDGNILNGAYFSYAQAESTQMGQPSVGLTFNEKGKELFCQITKNNIGRLMAIYIGGEQATAATIQDAICDGKAQLSGGFDRERALLTAKELNSGNMPAALILLQEEKVSPSLGDSAFKGALIATLVGSIAIIIYMFFIYGWRKALITVLTLILYFTLLLAIIKLIDYALSLSGIAAIILSIGMAVDANILIFERMNEEVHSGKSVKTAINTAERRSRSAIRDGQISTLLIWVLLFAYGINMFKWFGSMIILTAILTLALNVNFIIEALHTIYKNEK